jgi:RimJ/RimL family protein N-acetyltransferase
VTRPPTLRFGDRFLLNGWEIGDAASHRRFAEDPVAARFLGWSVDEARSQGDAHYARVVERFQQDWPTGSRLAFAIRVRSTGEPVGAVEVRPVDDTMWVSYLVDRDWRGRGIAPAAVMAVLQWAADECLRAAPA